MSERVVVGHECLRSSQIRPTGRVGGIEVGVPRSLLNRAEPKAIGLEVVGGDLGIPPVRPPNGGGPAREAPVKHDQQVTILRQ